MPQEGTLPALVWDVQVTPGGFSWCWHRRDGPGAAEGDPDPHQGLVLAGLLPCCDRSHMAAGPGGSWCCQHHGKLTLRGQSGKMGTAWLQPPWVLQKAEDELGIASPPPSSHTVPPIALGLTLGLRIGLHSCSLTSGPPPGGTVLCSGAGSVPSPTGQLPANQQHCVCSHACPQLRAGRRR